MGNKFHDERGRFASGSEGAAARGDHQAVSPDATKRVVSGKSVPREKVVTEHAGPSVGTSSGRLSAAARDNIIRGKGVDARHYGVPSDTQGARLRSDTGSRTDLGGAQYGFQSKPGSFRVRARVKM